VKVGLRAPFSSDVLNTVYGNLSHMVLLCEGSSIIFANKMALNVLASSDDADALSNVGLEEFVQEDYKEIIAEALAEICLDVPFLPVEIFPRSGEQFAGEIRVTSLDEGRDTLVVEISDVSAKKNSSEIRVKSEVLLRKIISSFDAAVIGVDQNQKIVEITPSGKEMLGISGDVSGRLLSDFITIENRAPEQASTTSTYQLLRKTLATTDKDLLHGTSQKADGTTIFLELVVNTSHDPSEIVKTYILRDVTDHLSDEETQLKFITTVFETSGEGILVTEPGGNILSINPAFSQITGYTADDVVGKTPQILRSEHNPQSLYKEMWESLNQNGHWNGELLNRRKNGEVYPEFLSINTIEIGGVVKYYIGVFHDLTERKAAEKTISYQASYDLLTGLPNRLLFVDRVNKAVSKAKADGGEVILMHLDLDDFGLVNDSLGYRDGDEILKDVAKRLKDCVRSVDTVARLGSDEFAILIENLDPDLAPEFIANGILENISWPIELENKEASVSASIGISIFPLEKVEPDILIRYAESATLQVKNEGKSAFRFFSPEMNKDATSRMAIKTGLSQALLYDQFVLHFQPVLDISENRISGVETLIRWDQPNQGILAPDRFISILEQTGQIKEVGNWVMKMACAQQVVLHDAGFPGMKVAVNVAAQQLADPNFLDDLLRAVDDAGTLPKFFELEITESSLIKDRAKVTDLLHRIRAKGFSIAIDDFGTGYSSLSYLRDLPVDTLKIDRSFVSSSTTTERDSKMLMGLINLSRGLELNVVAEGVETEVQLVLARTYRCKQAQGYFISRPLSHRQLLDFLYKQEKTSKAS